MPTVPKTQEAPQKRVINVECTLKDYEIIARGAEHERRSLSNYLAYAGVEKERERVRGFTATEAAI